MTITLAPIDRTAIELATRHLPLSERVDFETTAQDGTKLARLFSAGLPAETLATLTGVTVQTVYRRMQAVYSETQYAALKAKAESARHPLHREAVAKKFFNFRNFPEMARENTELVKEFGSAEEVDRQVRAAQRIGALPLPRVQPRQNLLVAG